MNTYLLNNMTLHWLFRSEKKRGAIRDESRKWPDNTVPYEFDQSFSK